MLTRLLGNRCYSEVRARETQTDVTPKAHYANLACLANSYSDISRVVDDATQQGFSQQHYHGAGINMETHSPFSANRFVLLPDPNLLKGPSQRRNRAMLQTLGINCAWTSVLHHPYSSLLSAVSHSSALPSPGPVLTHSLNVNTIKKL
ncbi:hypothetical protein AMECASPLE_037274 [Ameca splendens]|uniref:Uncharacterized protein n=1 Tax=Ameca splendens TaxID=208324 RepID=A0ABV0YJ13_9TELE